MDNSIQFNYLAKLIGFWQKLNTREQVLFRNILMLSAPNRSIGMDMDEYINQFVALGKFRTEMQLIDLGGEAKNHWLSEAMITACKGLLDKGLVWLDEGHFQIDGISFRFTGYAEQLSYPTRKGLKEDDDLERF